MDNWKTYELGDLLLYEQPSKYIVDSTNYNNSYAVPVLTAGKSFILGYTNEEDGIYPQEGLPVIIFDDFTTSSKYVDFSFKVKSSAMKILKPNTALVLPKYIFYRMQIIQFEHSTHKRYWIQQYSKLKVAIPNISEQQRVVEQIEEMLSQLDNGELMLQKTKRQIDVYRQSVLKSAFDAISNGKKSTIMAVCEKVVDCPHSTPKWVESGKLCLRTTNFKRGYLDLSEKNYVSNETFDARNKRLVPKPGDILFSREGAILGIACIIPEKIEVCLGQRMMLLRTNKSINNKFLMYYLNSPMVNKLVMQSIGGTASPHINVGDIKEFLIPTPDISNQLAIVREIEARLSVCDNIEKTIESALKQAGAIRQSILKNALEGRT